MTERRRKFDHGSRRVRFGLFAAACVPPGRQRRVPRTQTCRERSEQRLEKPQRLLHAAVLTVKGREGDRIVIVHELIRSG